MQSRCTHLNKRLPCIGVLRFNAPAQRRLAKVANRSTPALGTRREERKFLSFLFGESRPLVIVCCGMALYEQARRATPQPPQANAYALAIMQSRCTHLNMRLPCIGVLRFNAPAQRRLAKVANRSTPALGTEREERKSLSFFCVWREPTFGRCVRCGMALYEQARQATPQPPQANAYALAIMQSRSTHLNKRLRGYDSDILLDLFKVCAIFFSGIRASLRLKSRCTSTPALGTEREERKSLSFFVFGESRPLVIVCVAVWLYTSKLAKPHPNPHRLTPMLSP